MVYLPIKKKDLILTIYINNLKSNILRKQIKFQKVLH